MNEAKGQLMIRNTTGTVLLSQQPNVRNVQGDDPHAVVSPTRNEQSSSETEKQEIQADDPQAAVIGEGKATPASDAVLTKITTGSFAFLDVKTKIM